MTTELCGDQEIFWIEALEYTKKALKQRVALWNGALEDILINKQA